MWEIFDKLCRENGVSPYKVCKDIGEQTATTTNWKKGRYTPKLEKLQKFADYFGVPVEYLRTGTMPNNIKKESHSVIDKYNSDQEFMLYIKRLWDLPPDSRQAIYKQIRFEEQEAKERRIESRKEA